MPAPTRAAARAVNVLLLGPPGSGKGRQAKRMASEYRLTHIEPGEIFRAAIAARTRIGLQIQPIVAAGKLVPDSLTIELIRERLSRLGPEEGFVLDGFPRTIAQAEHLDRLLDEIRRPLSNSCAAALRNKNGRTLPSVHLARLRRHAQSSSDTASGHKGWADWRGSKTTP